MLEEESVILKLYNEAEFHKRVNVKEKKEYEDKFKELEILHNKFVGVLPELDKDLQRHIDITLDIINIIAPYEFVNGFCAAFELMEEVRLESVKLNIEKSI